MKSLKLFLFIILMAFATQVTAQKVYTTKTGEKYHKSSCKYLKYSMKEYTLEEAIELGYEACSVCKPNKVNTVASSSSNANALSGNEQSTTQARSTTATQCIGKTKAGKRCKRTTKNSNGRCYQH